MKTAFGWILAASGLAFPRLLLSYQARKLWKMRMCHGIYMGW